jgi:hypothetical protein
MKLAVKAAMLTGALIAAAPAMALNASGGRTWNEPIGATPVTDPTWIEPIGATPVTDPTWIEPIRATPVTDPTWTS